MTERLRNYRIRRSVVPVESSFEERAQRTGASPDVVGAVVH
jgi:hypothetical protein